VRSLCCTKHRGNLRGEGDSSHPAPVPQSDERRRSHLVEGIRDVRAWLVSLSDFGDLAVLLPLAAAMLAWLLLCVPRAAPRWVLALGFCLGLIALLKIGFYACPLGGDMHSPSGHTSFSTLVFGAVTLVAAAAWPGVRSVVVIGGGTGLILVIGFSRLLLGVHSVAEVSLGFAIGTVSLAAFSHKYRQTPHMKVWPLLIVALVLVSVFHGDELHAEQLLHRLTVYVPVHCAAKYLGPFHGDLVESQAEPHSFRRGGSL
jgi:membrane-associated phospholipid phosphatase